MYRTLPYIVLFLAVILLQVFLFDNLSISIYLNPLVYIAFVLLLPLDALPVAVLLCGLGTGVVMDYAMGAAGLNTIATLAVAFVRPWLLPVLYRRDDLREGGVPSSDRLGRRVFVRYLVILVLLHHTLFFTLEALSWAHLLHTLLRIAASSALTVGFVWLIARLFTDRVRARV